MAEIWDIMGFQDYAQDYVQQSLKRPALIGKYNTTIPVRISKERLRHCAREPGMFGVALQIGRVIESAIVSALDENPVPRIKRISVSPFLDGSQIGDDDVIVATLELWT